MNKTTMAILLIVSAFAWQSIAQAASISSRVRALESKVAKHDRAIKAESSARQKQSKEVKESLAQVEELQHRVNYLIRQQKKNKTKKPVKGKDPTIYSFP